LAGGVTRSLRGGVETPRRDRKRKGRVRAMLEAERGG